MLIQHQEKAISQRMQKMERARRHPGAPTLAVSNFNSKFKAHEPMTMLRAFEPIAN